MKKQTLLPKIALLISLVTQLNALSPREVQDLDAMINESLTKINTYKSLDSTQSIKEKLLEIDNFFFPRLKKICDKIDIEIGKTNSYNAMSLLMQGESKKGLDALEKVFNDLKGKIATMPIISLPNIHTITTTQDEVATMPSTSKTKTHETATTRDKVANSPSTSLPNTHETVTKNAPDFTATLYKELFPTANPQRSIHTADEEDGWCLCSTASVPNRLKLIRTIVSDAASTYNKSQKLVYTSLGSGGFLQDYLTLRTLLDAGFKNILVNLIDPIYFLNYSKAPVEEEITSKNSKKKAQELIARLKNDVKEKAQLTVVLYKTVNEYLAKRDPLQKSMIISMVDTVDNDTDSLLGNPPQRLLYALATEETTSDGPSKQPHQHYPLVYELNKKIYLWKSTPQENQLRWKKVEDSTTISNR